jgi:hypothetical protein
MQEALVELAHLVALVAAVERVALVEMVLVIKGQVQTVARVVDKVMTTQVHQ